MKHTDMSSQITVQWQPTLLLSCRRDSRIPGRPLPSGGRISEERKAGLQGLPLQTLLSNMNLFCTNPEGSQLHRDIVLHRFQVNPGIEVAKAAL